MNADEFFIWQIYFEEHCRPTVIDRRGVFIRHELTNPPRPIPASQVAYWLSVLWLVVVLWLLMAMFSTAHAGQPATVASSPRHTRRMTRITVLKPVRAQGRAQAAYPMLQIGVNVTRIGVNLSGLINPIGWFF